MVTNVRRRAAAAGFAACVAFACGAATAAQAPAPVDLVFYAPFLKNAPDGSTISYRYVREANDPKLVPSFEDDVKLRVAPEGAKDSVAIDLFTAGRGGTLTNQSRTGAPVVVAVWDRDVKEMSKVLGGSFFYLQNRIMEALRNGGDAIEPQKVEYDGRTLDGWKVTLKPFANDERHRELLREFANLTYELTFADDVPGGFYALKTLAPRAGADDKPVLREELRIQSSDAGSPKPMEPKQP